MIGEEQKGSYNSIAAMKGSTTITYPTSTTALSVLSMNTFPTGVSPNITFSGSVFYTSISPTSVFTETLSLSTDSATAELKKTISTSREEDRNPILNPKRLQTLPWRVEFEWRRLYCNSILAQRVRLPRS